MWIKDETGFNKQKSCDFDECLNDLYAVVEITLICYFWLHIFRWFSGKILFDIRKIVYYV